MSSRRSFLKNGSKISLGFLGLESYLAMSMKGCELPTFDHELLVSKYGPLSADRSGVLKLPEGFTSKIVAQSGKKMTDGYTHPDKPDGMATFQGATNDEVIILRNHELMPNDNGPFGLNNRLAKKFPKDKFYDPGLNGYYCNGGVTTLVYNEATQSLDKSFLSLAGTLRNCAGGQYSLGVLDNL